MKREGDDGDVTPQCTLTPERHSRGMRGAKGREGCEPPRRQRGLEVREGAAVGAGAHEPPRREVVQRERDIVVQEVGRDTRFELSGLVRYLDRIGRDHVAARTVARLRPERRFRGLRKRGWNAAAARGARGGAPVELRPDFQHLEGGAGREAAAGRGAGELRGLNY